ncbi:Sec-independent protein translocase subunit TatA [Kitasatospora sp. NPDC085879]|jgi:sec-independent protein translocase protein TatA|uniref:Sec-independent protein translocase subunit TatA n=1 Tax=Kitasatospora sp. NPDC085879 TaxID=3154769 RepID=UPI003422E94B
MRISPTAILVVAVLAVLLFGAKRLPDAARALGRSLRILRSEAAALRADGSGPAPQARPEAGPAPMTIKPAPGSGDARPVAPADRGAAPRG